MSWNRSLCSSLTVPLFCENQLASLRSWFSMTCYSQDVCISSGSLLSLLCSFITQKVGCCWHKNLSCHYFFSSVKIFIENNFTNLGMSSLIFVTFILRKLFCIYLNAAFVLFFVHSLPGILHRIKIDVNKWQHFLWLS